MVNKNTSRVNTKIKKIIDVAEIERIFSDLFYRRVEPKRREIKLWILFNSEGQANEWLEKVWKPLLLEQINKDDKTTKELTKGTHA